MRWGATQLILFHTDLGVKSAPWDFIGRQLRAVAAGEEDGVEAPGRFAWEEVVKECLVQFGLS